MPKKTKTLEVKLRSAIRLIWSRSAERRAVIKGALSADKSFVCPVCLKQMPDWAGEVDHVVPVGPLEDWRQVVPWMERMFYGKQRLICKSCHRSKTKEDRKAMRRKK